ncbi:MAG: uroporphyrinogen decarboxylase/cobalamine-independent methonine synthase family protein [Deltaproteobacteria bacterium]
MSPLRVPRLATTALGSLPCTDVREALELAFSVDAPFLPELPRRAPAEGRLARALEGLPGLRIDAEGRCTVGLETWRRERAALDVRLGRALGKGDPKPFEPSPKASRAFEPFMVELRRREVRVAKAQVAGPVTAVFSVKLADGRPASAEPELAEQIARLVTARALALAHALSRSGASAAIVFLDEPGLVSLDPRNPRHSLRLRELRLAAAALVRVGARPGLHCCGETHWASLLPLGFTYLSLDVERSLDGVLADRPLLERFVDEGGRLALGLVPTDRAPELGEASPSGGLLDRLEAALPGPLVERLLTHCLLTPACGLAGLTQDGARVVLRALGTARAELSSRLGDG